MLNNNLSRNLFISVGAVFILFVGFIGGYALRSASNSPVLSSDNVINKDIAVSSTTKPTDFSLFWTVWNLLDERYVPTHDESFVSPEDRVYGAIAGLTRSLGDPYTEFLPPEESIELSNEITGNFSGVGMEVGIQNDLVTVISPLKGSPAEKAGIKSGDIIIKVDDEEVLNFSVAEVVKRIRGEADTEVTLTILRKNEEPRDIKIVRALIDIPTLDVVNRNDGITIISLYNFFAPSVDLFAQAMTDFSTSNRSKLIIDLRGNPGGFLDAATEIASFFVPEGKVIVSETIKNGEFSDHRSKGYAEVGEGLKIVVLVDGGSASASEILAGALQDYKIATLIGETTFGKGSVQEVIDLPNGTSLKVTVARWFTPLKQAISGNGLEPDIKVEVTKADIEKGRDPQLEKAIEFLNQ